AALEGPAARAEIPGRTSGRRPGARARGGLGAPLSELPPSAALTGSAAPGARTPRTAPDPVVQRAPAGQDRKSGAVPEPGTADRDRPDTRSAQRAADTRSVPPAPGGSGVDAPILGTGDARHSVAAGGGGVSEVQRRTTGHVSSPGPTGHGDGPATPLVTPSRSGASPRPASEDATGMERSAAPEGSTGNTRRPGPPDGVTGSGSRGRRNPNAPAQVLVARAPAAGTAGARTSGTAGPGPRTVTRSAANPGSASPRTLSLLAARPLTLNTRAPEGVASPAASRSGSRPVVAARWPGAPAAPGRGSVGPSAAPSAGTSATPQVQRAAADRSGPGGGPDVHGVGSHVPVQGPPVVRPAPPLRGAAGAAAPGSVVPARPLPVAAPQPLAGRPPVTPASVTPAAGSVPVVRPRTGPPSALPPAAGGTGQSAPVIQRDVTGSGGSTASKGVPAKAAQPGATPSAAKSTARHAESSRDPGADLDDLARRLLDPMARLLRTELRRGRDRTGRPYDGRR
ncbi:hypothetical protein ACFVW8_25355, partial [Streptomyces sp. NPDC058221]